MAGLTRASPRTRAEYRKVLDGKRLAYFAGFTLEEITPAMVKAWWISHDDGYPTARRKTYDLLHAILATAAEQDEDTDAPALIGTNPARLSAKTKNGVPTSRPKGSIRPASLAELVRHATRRWCCSPQWCAPRFGELT